MQIHQLDQGTPEWFEVRKGKMTASHSQAIGNAGKGLDTYIFEILAEKFSSGEKANYSNEHMERGKELEGQARAMYELQNNVTVVQVGFIEMDQCVGCSPDGLVNEDGGCEIKCHDDVKHTKMLINGASEIDSGYIWQCQMNMLITDRKWWDLIFYNPNFKRTLIIFRIQPDPVKMDALRKGFEIGRGKIEALNKLMQ